MKSPSDNALESPVRPTAVRLRLTGLTLILVAITFSFAVNLRAQGRVTFSNVGGPGLTNYLTGTSLPSGTLFRAQLYYAPDGETNLLRFVPLGAPTMSLLPGGF
jgi:hypothetical protein